jgi:predicted RecA/RadA family phage recombinase
MESQYINQGDSLDFTPVAAITGGDLVQLGDGRAAHSPLDIAAGVLGAVKVTGLLKLPKTVNIALLDGGDAYWDVSAGKVHFRPEAGTPDFRAGIVFGDYAAAATECYILLNERASYTIDLGAGGECGDWVAEELAAGVAGSVDAIPGGGCRIVISNENAVQANALRSVRTVPGSSKPILEFRFTRSATTDAAVDLDIGLATSAHASDFEAVTAFAAFHYDGDDLNIDTHSDDNVTDRAPADSSIDHVEGTYHEGWIDGRDPTDVKFYVDGVLVDTSSAKRTLAAAQNYAAVFMTEKTTGTAVGGGSVSRLRVRTKGE